MPATAGGFRRGRSARRILGGRGHAGALRAANALSALYPKDIDEKRLLDAMLLAVPRKKEQQDMRGEENETRVAERGGLIHDRPGDSRAPKPPLGLSITINAASR